MFVLLFQVFTTREYRRKLDNLRTLRFHILYSVTVPPVKLPNYLLKQIENTYTAVGTKIIKWIRQIIQVRVVIIALTVMRSVPG